MKAVHLGSKIDLIGAAEKHGGVMAPAKAYLLIQAETAVYYLFPFGSYVAIISEGMNPDLDFRPFVGKAHEEIQDDFHLTVSPDKPEKVEFEKVTVNSAGEVGPGGVADGPVQHPRALRKSDHRVDR